MSVEETRTGDRNAGQLMCPECGATKFSWILRQVQFVNYEIDEDGTRRGEPIKNGPILGTDDTESECHCTECGNEFSKGELVPLARELDADTVGLVLETAHREINAMEDAGENVEEFLDAYDEVSEVLNPDEDEKPDTISIPTDVDAKSLGLMKEAAAREIDAMNDHGMDTEEQLDAYNAVRTSLYVFA